MCETICYPQERRIGNPAYEYRKLKECEVSPEVFGLVDEFCKDYKTRVDVDRTIHSLLRYQTLRRDLSLFVCRNYKVRDITLAEPDQSFAEKFTAYLKHVRGLADTTVSVEIKSLQHIVKKAFNDGQTDKNPFAYYYYVAEQSEIEYLTEEDINRLINGRVRQQRQDRTRDMFLFCCFTGLSYADLAKLNYEELKQTPDGEWWISSIRQKTKVAFTVKLLSVAKATRVYTFCRNPDRHSSPYRRKHIRHGRR